MSRARLAVAGAAITAFVLIIIWEFEGDVGTQAPTPSLPPLTPHASQHVLIPQGPASSGAMWFNATTEDGAPQGWQFGLRALDDDSRYVQMVILHPTLEASATACSTYVASSPLQAVAKVSDWHPAARALAGDTGPDHFEAFVNVGLQTSNSSFAARVAVGVQLHFWFDPASCRYASREAVDLGRPSQGTGRLPIGLTTFVYATHVHERYNGLNELREGAHFPYAAGSRGKPFPRLGAVRGARFVPLVYDARQEVYRAPPSTRLSSHSGPPVVYAHHPAAPATPPFWVATRRDPHYCAYHTSPQYKGYYLTYKGFRGAACAGWGAEGHAALSSIDLLGRMDFGAEYKYAPHTRGAARDRLLRVVQKKGAGGLADGLPLGCRYLADEGASQTAADGAPLISRECILSLVGGGSSASGRHTIHFVGDSHMRLFFYGFLSRMGVSYPYNKIWRGDRTDTITGDGGLSMRVSFVASYFLNLTKESAVAMLAESKDDASSTVVAGVGQHHTSNCWSLRRDQAVVEEALATMLPGRNVVWFGIPAQPYNAHLSVPKPVGQGRRDCRNNQRHAFVHRQQAELMRTAPGGPVPTIDAMAMSEGMAHTSLDGAHFYSWARDAWIDELMIILLERHLRGTLL